MHSYFSINIFLKELLILRNTNEQYKEKMLEFDHMSSEYHDCKKDNENLKFKVEELNNG